MNGRSTDEFVAALAQALRPLVAELVAEELDRRDARPETRWLTVEEAAAERRTSPAAMRKRLERGQVAGAVKEGKRWLIPSAPPADTVDDPDNMGRAPHQRPRPGNRRY